MHPGGPFWARRDLGAWSIPKGEHDEDETAEQAARREFAEETGQPLAGELVPLGSIRQKAGKRVEAFAVEGDFDVADAAFGHLRDGMAAEKRPPPGLSGGRPRRVVPVGGGREAYHSRPDPLSRPSRRPSGHAVVIGRSGRFGRARKKATAKTVNVARISRAWRNEMFVRPIASLAALAIALPLAAAPVFAAGGGSSGGSSGGTRWRSGPARRAVQEGPDLRQAQEEVRAARPGRHRRRFPSTMPAVPWRWPVATTRRSRS